MATANVEEAKFQEENANLKKQKYSLVAQILLRTLTIVGTITATCVMVSAKQTTEVFGMKLDARYSYSSAFKFFAFANGVACAFSVLSLFLTFVLGRQVSKVANFFFLFLHDLLMMSLVLAGCAAATAIGYVGRYGYQRTGWMPICDNFGKFCDRVTTAVVFSYLSFVLLLILTIISAIQSRQSQV